MFRKPCHRPSEVRPQDRWEIWPDRDERRETIDEIETHEPVSVVRRDTQGQWLRCADYSCCYSLLENLPDSVVWSIAKWISGALKWAERMPTASTVFT